MAEVVEFGKDSPLTGQELRSGKDTSRIEFSGSGGGFLARAGASIPAKTEGKVKFLESQFGQGNVFTTPKGEILIRDEKTGSFVPFDERGFSIKDITADIVGPAMEAAPIAIGATEAGGVSFGTASPLGAAAGAAVGTIARQAATDVLTGGQSGETPGERLLNIGVNAAIGGTAQFLINSGARVFDALRPRNFVSRQVTKAERKPFAKKGERLSRVTGTPLTLGEQTGARSQLMVESIGRRTPGGSDLFYMFHQNQLRSSLANLKTSLDRISPQKGSLVVGSDIKKSFDSALESARTIRRAQAAEDFGKLHSASGGKQVIPTKNLSQSLQQIIDELDVPGAGDATQRVVNQAKKLLNGLVGKDGTKLLTAEQTQRLLQIYTNAQSGTGLLLRDMEKSQSRLLAGQLKDALLNDLDSAVEQSGSAVEIVDALRTARDHYRINSVAVNQIADSTLSRLIGNGTKSPEAIAERLLKLQPSEIKDVMGIITSASPETASSVRRFFVESAIDYARQLPPSQQTASGVKFSASRFLKALPDLKTMKAAGFSRKEIVDISHVAKILERVTDKAFEGSPTAFAGITWDAIKGVFTFNPIALARSAAAVLTPRMIAKAVLTPEGRQALRTASTTSVRTKKGLAAFTTLQAIIAREPSPEDVRPLSALKNDKTFTMENVFNGSSEK